MERGNRVRRRKTYFPRVHPMIRYDEQKFQERYRLPKGVVEQLSVKFEESGMCSTRLGARGGGLSSDDRVSKQVGKKQMMHDNWVVYFA